jgi:hypothetical protein
MYLPKKLIIVETMIMILNNCTYYPPSLIHYKFIKKDNWVITLEYNYH